VLQKATKDFDACKKNYYFGKYNMSFSIKNNLGKRIKLEGDISS
jgi:hypothetical protein